VYAERAQEAPRLANPCELYTINSPPLGEITTAETTAWQPRYVAAHLYHPVKLACQSKDPISTLCHAGNKSTFQAQWHRGPSTISASTVLLLVPQWFEECSASTRAGCKKRSVIKSSG
jgi:hypothetical protein